VFVDESARSEAELTVLRLLLSVTPPVEQPNAAATDLKVLLDQLSDYAWSDEEHRVVYKSLRTALRGHAAGLRREMASVATRLGHPDVEWDSYFRRPAENLDGADLIRRLKSNTL
jgi:hypothetical protein